MIQTTIHSNGSKWAGEAPDSVEKLLQVLAEHPLHRVFARYGGFCEHCEETGVTRFFGNFLTISHVFRIDSNDPAIVEPLRKAINANKRRKDYLAQPDGSKPRKMKGGA